MKYIFIILFFICTLGVGSAVAQENADRVKISSTMTEIDGVRFAVHSVARREDLQDIAAAYGVKANDIVRYNPQARGKLKFRSSLLIPISAIDEPDDIDSTTMDDTELDPAAQDSLLLDVLSRSVFEFGLVRQPNANEPLEVKLLLPFGIENSNAKKGFVEFYNGFLLGLQELGSGLNLEVISTNRTRERAEEIVLDSMLYNANVIIGPVYEEEMAVIAPYAACLQIPVFSPLVAFSAELNPYVVELAPSVEYQWDAIKELVAQDNVNVIVIEHQTQQNKAAMSAVESYLNPLSHRVAYENKFTNVKNLSEHLSRSLPNLIFLPVDSELVVEEILTRYSSLNAQGLYNIAFVGTPQWARFSKINMELFYKLSVSYPASYHYDRMMSPASEVFSRYVTKHSLVPTLFSMRGYDAAKIAVGELLDTADKLLYSITTNVTQPIQTPYDFELMDNSSKIENTKWPLVQYKPNFTIEVRWAKYAK